MSYAVNIDSTTDSNQEIMCIAEILENGEQICVITRNHPYPSADNINDLQSKVGNLAQEIIQEIARYASREIGQAVATQQFDLACRLLSFHPITVEFIEVAENLKNDRSSWLFDWKKSPKLWQASLRERLNDQLWEKRYWIHSDRELGINEKIVPVLAEALRNKSWQCISQAVWLFDEKSDTLLSRLFDSTFFEFQQISADADNATIMAWQASFTEIIKRFLNFRGRGSGPLKILDRKKDFPYTHRSLVHSIVRYAKKSDDFTWLILTLKKKYVSPDLIESFAPLLYSKVATSGGITQIFDFTPDTDMQYRLLALLLDKDAEGILLEYPASIQAYASATREARKFLEDNRSSSSTARFLGDEKFLSFLEKLIKTGKAIGAIHGLHSYFVGLFCYYGLHEHGIKRLCDCYIKCFIALKQYNLLGKYYPHIEALNQNLEFLEAMIPYFLEINEPERAAEALERMTQLEPSYPFLVTATREIERCRLVKSLSSQNIDLQSLDSLSGQEFEALIIRKFREMGFDAQPTPSSGDFGADILVENKEQTRFVIQCKRFKAKVNLKAVQEVVAALAHFNGDIGIVITNNTFLSSAVKLAESNDIELWDSMKLMRFLAGDLSFSAIGECGE